MSRLSYLAVLAGCLLGSAWVELALGTGVFRRWRRLVLALLPAVVLFVAWDLAAIAAGHWSYDERQTTGVRFGPLPLEELVFFLVVPTAAILAFEAVRAVRGWPAGDEPAAGRSEGDR